MGVGFFFVILFRVKILILVLKRYNLALFNQLKVLLQTFNVDNQFIIEVIRL